ncbi:hypothetical protein CH375_01970 [Leptospira ellisii]|uniref:Uncharacterized protein n=1 Tax=Leptospira ellisii TaxID=2023197 RepID=A0A2N0BPV3_9LEPT|nr:hypothetical protein CH379_19990 [Leptospira ellisii]PKA06030.1 hypothetical protein CH375_01970 [Leptospira ellisii]
MTKNRIRENGFPESRKRRKTIRKEPEFFRTITETEWSQEDYNNAKLKVLIPSFQFQNRLLYRKEIF